MKKITISLFISCLALILFFNAPEISLANDYQQQKEFDNVSSQSRELYIALGDSFAAGLGANNYILSSGTCFRSKNAFPIDEEYGIAKIFNFIPKFYACSGATTKTLLKSQINKHKSLLIKSKLVTVIIGGNNVNFPGVLSFCLFNSNCNNYFSYKTINLQKKIDNQLNTLTNTFKTLRKSSPYALIYVLGYPYLFNKKYDYSCDISKFIEPEEQEFLNNMTDHLNYVIEKAALKAGIIFLSVKETFSGHEICSEEPWVNSFNIQENSLLESFHPNEKGQKAYADIIKQAIK